MRSPRYIYSFVLLRALGSGFTNEIVNKSQGSHRVITLFINNSPLSRPSHPRESYLKKIASFLMLCSYPWLNSKIL